MDWVVVSTPWQYTITEGGELGDCAAMMECPIQEAQIDAIAETTRHQR